jgi:hypothetical protein
MIFEVVESQPRSADKIDKYQSNEVQVTPVGEQQQQHKVIRRIESRLLKEYDDVRDNQRMTLTACMSVLHKTGTYILNMGLVNFFEYLIINLLLILHVDRRQRLILNSGRQTSFIEANVSTYLL